MISEDLKNNPRIFENHHDDHDQDHDHDQDRRQHRRDGQASDSWVRVMEATLGADAAKVAGVWQTDSSQDERLGSFRENPLFG